MTKNKCKSQVNLEETIEEMTDHIGEVYPKKESWEMRR